MSEAILYIVRNSINNKIYIGCIWAKNKSIFDRLNEHKNNLGGKHLFEAMEKLGKDNFWIEELKRGSIDYIRKLEVRMIRRFSHMKDNKGYNGCLSKAIVLSETGKASMVKKLLGRKNGPLKNETKEKIRQKLIGVPFTKERCRNISKAGIGRVASKEARKNISIAVTGKKNGFYNKTHSDEFKKKLRELRIKEADERGRKIKVFKRINSCGKRNPMFGKIGRITGSKNPNARPITVNNIRYETMKEASQATGITMYKLRRWYLK